MIIYGHIGARSLSSEIYRSVDHRSFHPVIERLLNASHLDEKALEIHQGRPWPRRPDLVGIEVLKSELAARQVRQFEIDLATQELCSPKSLD